MKTPSVKNPSYLLRLKVVPQNGSYTKNLPDIILGGGGGVGKYFKNTPDQNIIPNFVNTLHNTSVILELREITLNKGRAGSATAAINSAKHLRGASPSSRLIRAKHFWQRETY